MVRLRDTGDGIPPENITRIFDPFYSGKGGPNAGMGLAVTQRIIESHGGSITAESRQGEGSLFKMELPLTSAEFDCSRDRKTASPDFQANILVVDDLRPVVEMISEGLREAGQTVIEADSGEQAIESYKNNAIDIVICDLAMPGMNGWAVWEELERIRRDRGVARPPFIMLSGWNEEDLNRSESSRSDLIQFVKKPVEMDRLLVIVRDLLEHGNMRSPH
jgi:CheY-like chemotaxis protein